MSTFRHHDWGQDIWATYRLCCYQKTHLADPHDHTFYELFWVESGQGRYWINGQLEALEPGDLVLVRPEDTHSFAAVRTGEFLEFVNVAFLPSVWPHLRQRYFRGPVAHFGHRRPQARRYRLRPFQVQRLGMMASGLRMGARDRLTVEAFVTAVLAMLEEPPENLQPSLPRWLALTLEQIRLYPNFAGGPAAMARLAHRSPEHVARECRRFLGRCPSDLVNAARLEYAAQELRTGQKPILDIALDCGIENLGHFYQLFRRHYAQTPARYRRKLQIPSTRPG